MSMNILDKLAAHAAERVEVQRELVPQVTMRSMAEDLARSQRQPGGEFPFPFTRALQALGLSFICEVKKASPSKGVIAEDFPYREIAHEYEEGGANAISVLTEPKWFLGSDAYLEQIARTVSLPVLRKDFTVDSYQIYQAKVLGADAVLLICAILDDVQLKEFRDIAFELGLSTLVEAHDAVEIERALDVGADIVGVNNRDLTDFSVSFENAMKLRHLIPPHVVYVAESGVKTTDDVRRIASMGADAMLVGEALMRSSHIVQKLGEFRHAASETKAVTQVKFCGLCQPDDVALFNEIKPEYAGFVFHFGSPREVSASQAAALRAALDVDIATVGVFVDAEPSFIASLARDHVISVAQLHGHEDETYIRELRHLVPNLEIWRAFIVRDRSDIEAANESSADQVLLDASRGGGTPFNWHLLSYVTRPFILAGGLYPENVAEAIAIYHPMTVDVSSGIEADVLAGDGRRRKDPTKMRRFVASVRVSEKGVRYYANQCC